MGAIKTLIGVVLCLAAVAAGLYVGLYLCLYGGIVMFVHGVTANPVSAGKIAFGVIRFFCASIAGWGSFALLFVPGLAFIHSDSPSSRVSARGHGRNGW